MESDPSGSGGYCVQYIVDQYALEHTLDTFFRSQLFVHSETLVLLQWDTVIGIGI